MPLCLGQPPFGTAMSAIDLMEGVLKVMFWNKFKVVAGSVLCGAAILTGSTVIACRAMGFPRPQADGARPQSKTPVEKGGVLNVPSTVASGLTKLTANEQARLDVAKKIRDRMFTRYSEGESDLVSYLRWQKRYDEIVGEIAKTDADRLRHYERQVAVMKQIEERSRQLYRNGQITETDVLIAELEHLEAEAALQRFQATLRKGAVPDNAATR